MKKAVRKEKVTDKERKEYMSKEGCIDIVNDLYDEKPFVSKDWKKRYVRKRVSLLSELSASDRLLKLSKKEGKRAMVCRALVLNGKISRKEYKQHNPWGDVRFIKEFVDEEVADDSIVYVLKKQIAEDIKNKV